MSNLRTVDHIPDTSTRQKLGTQSRLYKQIARAIEYISDNRLDQPELDDVARHVGMSTHQCRCFRSTNHQTPIDFGELTHRSDI